MVVRHRGPSLPTFRVGRRESVLKLVTPRRRRAGCSVVAWRFCRGFLRSDIGAFAMQRTGRSAATGRRPVLPMKSAATPSPKGSTGLQTCRCTPPGGQHRTSRTRDSHLAAPAASNLEFRKLQRIRFSAFSLGEVLPIHGTSHAADWRAHAFTCSICCRLRLSDRALR